MATGYRDFNWQIETREHPRTRMEFCNSLITRKIEASIKTLEKAVGARMRGKGR